MKTRLKITFITIGSILISIMSQAQDFHFSQFDANPLYLNPALLGERLFENKGIQSNMNYREQIGNYNQGAGSNASVAAGCDAVLNNNFSIGEFVINNRSVGGSFNTFNLMLAGAYRVTKNQDEHDRHNLSIGLQLGILQKSFHPEKFLFDSQYSPLVANGFDKNLPNGENFATQSFFKFDANVGVYYRLTSKNRKSSFFVGFSIYHFTQPNESFYQGFSPIPIRYTANIGLLTKINEAVTILPQVLYMNQAKANELNAGMLLFYKLKNSNYEPLLGCSWRNKNAIVFHLGLKTKSTIFRISYDINTYYLKQYHNRGLEFSMIFTCGKKNKPEPESILK